MEKDHISAGFETLKRLADFATNCQDVTYTELAHKLFDQTMGEIGTEATKTIDASSLRKRAIDSICRDIKVKAYENPHAGAVEHVVEVNKNSVDISGDVVTILNEQGFKVDITNNEKQDDETEEVKTIVVIYKVSW